MSWVQATANHVAAPRFAVHVEGSPHIVVGIFDSFEDAVSAIRLSIEERRPLVCWTQAQVVVHNANVETLGIPDARRAFRADGTVYTPDKHSEETWALPRRLTRAQAARWGRK